MVMILYLKNREFAPTPTWDIISYRMRRSKKLAIQGAGNGCGGMTVQKKKKEQSVVRASSATRKASCLHTSRGFKEGEKRKYRG